MKKTIFTLSFLLAACMLKAQVLYGTTAIGGNYNKGTICKLATTTNTLTAAFSFNGADGAYPPSNLLQASDGKLYGMTYYGGDGYGVIFSYDPATSTYTKLTEFDGTNGGYPYGSLIQASDGKLYGMTSQGGIDNDGVIFSYDPVTSTFKRLQNFDYTMGSPLGSLMQASDGKLYGVISFVIDYNLYGYIFSYDPVTTIFKEFKVFDGANGANPSGSLIQASDGKLYGMTGGGGSNGFGVIFSYDPVASIYTKLKDFDHKNGRAPVGRLVQASDGKLYGMTSRGGSKGFGVAFSYDPADSTYTKLIDFDSTNGAYPGGSLVQASDGKLYGMTSSGGSKDFGVAFSYDLSTSTYTELSDFNGNNGSYPAYTSFIELRSLAAEPQISILDISVPEGNQDIKFISIPIVLNEKSEKIIQFNYATQNNSATAGSDYIAQSGTLVFPPHIKKIVLPVRIVGDETPEADETFSIILSDPVNATIADNTGVVTILDDDAIALNAAQELSKTIRAINLSPNPAQDKVSILLTEYSGNVVIQLSSFDGRILQQKKLQTASAKIAQQPIDISAYANGIYLVTVIDEKGNRQTEKLVIKR